MVSAVSQVSAVSLLAATAYSGLGTQKPRALNVDEVGLGD